MNSPPDHIDNQRSASWSLHFIALGALPLALGSIALVVSVGAALGLWNRPAGAIGLDALACFVVGYVACVTLPMLHRRIASLEAVVESRSSQS